MRHATLTMAEAPTDLSRTKWPANQADSMAVCRENLACRLLRYAPLSALLPRHALLRPDPASLPSCLLLTLAGCAKSPALSLPGGNLRGRDAFPVP